MTEHLSAEKVVLARKSYEHLIRTRDRALREAEYVQERIESVERWARDCCAQERRLADRLTAVVMAAASLGVPIDAINEALDICRCGCPKSAHVGDIGCPCGLPDDPPCVATPPGGSAS